jgi:hypothetical protein
VVTVAYTKTTFVDGQEPYVSADELNKIGNGITEAHNRIAEVERINGLHIDTYYTGLPQANTLINISNSSNSLTTYNAIVIVPEITVGNDIYRGSITIPIDEIVKHTPTLNYRMFYTIPVKYDTTVTIELYKSDAPGHVYLKIKHIGNINYLRVYGMK